MAKKVVPRIRNPEDADDKSRRRPPVAAKSDEPESADAAKEDTPRLDPTKKVGLFVTCLVDIFRPSVGFAAVELLEAANCRVAVPRAQTCCGQPAYNSGDRADTRKIAKKVIRTFRAFDYVVAPSGSCAGMLKRHYPELFANDPKWSARAQSLANRTYELVSFLTDICGMEAVEASYDGIAAYHDSCSSQREMGVKEQPRQLLGSVQGLTVRDLPGSEVCCGFGGAFCVKYPDISNRMAGDKAAEVLETGADTLLAGDLGCLINLAGKLHREGADLKVFHVAEVLAGKANKPIGVDEQKPNSNPDSLSDQGRDPAGDQA